jgi:membrane-associated phospholipid phosphatase
MLPVYATLMAVPAPIMVARIVAIAVGLGLWYLTQALLAKRVPKCPDQASIFDGIHHLTRRCNQRLLDNPRKANALLIASSLVIDLLGGYVLISAVIGPTIQPFLGLLMIFALRQLCQAFCPLPPPAGMIWRDPGFPTALVTYGTSNDLFFSGHTALAVYGATVLATALGPWGIVLGVLIALFEIATVLVLRAHYTMDVFAGAVTALFVHTLAWKIAPVVDQWIARLAG